MKKLLVSLILVFAALSALASDPFVCTEVGTVLEYEIKAADKIVGYQVIALTDSECDGDDLLLTFSIEQLDDKHNIQTVNNVPLRNTHTGRLTPTGYVVSARDAMSRELLNGLMQSGVDDIAVECDDVVLPNRLKVGDTISDCHTEVRLSMSGYTVTIRSHTTGNRVAARETINTPAGVFDCYKIVYNNHVELDMIGMSFDFTSAQWFAEGVGMVLTETEAAGQKTVQTLIRKVKTDN